MTVGLQPELAGELLQQLNALIDQMVGNGQQPIMLTAPNVRLALRKLAATNFPSLYVLSYNEIAPEIEVSAVGIIRMDNENQEIHGTEHAASVGPSS